MSHMADAYAFRSLWDLRIYTIKIWIYTGTATVVSILGTSVAEEVFNFSLFNWLIGL